MEPQYNEIVDVEAVDRMVLLAAVLVPAACLLGGLLLGATRGRLGLQVQRALVVGTAGPLVLGLWHFYRYMIRLDHDTGYVGLHRMSVYILNIAVFTVVGALLGVLYARLATRLWPLKPHSPPAGSPEEISSPNTQGGV